MKNSFLFIVVLLGTLILSLFICRDIGSSTSETNDSIQSDEGPVYPMEAFEFDLYRVVNPNTGKVPAFSKWHVYEQLKAEGRVPSFKMQEDNYGAYWIPANDFFEVLSITKMTYDPNDTQTFYFCTGEGWYNADAVRGSGVWKSTDAGENWVQLSSTDNAAFYYCQDIKVHHLTSDIYVATRTGGVQRSQDGGVTFNKVLGKGAGAPVNSVCDIEFAKLGGIFATLGILFETGGGVYYSDTGDDGDWSRKVDSLPKINKMTRIKLATAPSNDSVAYVIPVTSTSPYRVHGVYKTINKGEEWFAVSDPGGNKNMAKKQAWYDLSLAVDPNDENVVIAGGLNLWRSRDGGDNWQQLTHNKYDSAGMIYVHVDQHFVLFQSSDVVYFANDGGLWRSTNMTAANPDFESLNESYNVTQYYTAAIHPDAGNNMIIGGTQDNGTHRSDGDSITEFVKLTGGDGAFCAFNHDNPDIVYTTKQLLPFFRFSNVSDGLYDTITNPYVEAKDILFINPWEMDPNDPDLLYMASDTGLWRLSNAATADAEDWELAAATIGAKISAIGISKSKPNTIYLGRRLSAAPSNTPVNIYKIENANNSTAIDTPIRLDSAGSLPKGRYVTTSCIYVNPNDVNHVIVTFSNYDIKSVFESKDADGPNPTWTSVEGNLPNIPVFWALIHPTNPEVCYLATELGIFFTNKLNGSSTNWVLSNQGLANVRTDMIRLRSSDNAVVAATHGRGLFTGTIPTTGTNYAIIWEERGPSNVGGRTRSVMIDPNDPTQKTLWIASIGGGLWKTNDIDSIGIEPSSLYTELVLNVSPVPFSSEGVTFSMEIPYESNVELNIYDISGRLVRQLVNEIMLHGKYTVNWDPASDVLSGIYLAQLRNLSDKTTLKVVYFSD